MNDIDTVGAALIGYLLLALTLVALVSIFKKLKTFRGSELIAGLIAGLIDEFKKTEQITPSEEKQ